MTHQVPMVKKDYPFSMSPHKSAVQGEVHIFPLETYAHVVRGGHIL
jgi:hypothetical protein